MGTASGGRPQVATDEEILQTIDEVDASGVNGEPTHRDLAAALDLSTSRLKARTADLEARGLVDRHISIDFETNMEAATLRRCDDGR